MPVRLAVADYDNDGDLDIYVNNYGPNVLYRNNGDGTFTDVSRESGVGEHEGWGMGAVCGDYDNDGDTDIYVANDVAANFLYENDGTGKFEEVGLITGVAYDLHGGEQGSMGVECGDYNNDGRLDFYQTCYAKELATLFRNLGGGVFEDVTLVTGAGTGTFPYVTWGTGFVDFDNDGDVDVVILNSRREPTVLRNDSRTGNHWIQIRLRGVKTNRDGVGARVKVVAGDLTQIDEVHSGRGYQSHYGMRLHFGLGKRNRVDRIEDRWIGGKVDVLENVDVDQLVTIAEGGTKAQTQHLLTKQRTGTRRAANSKWLGGAYLCLGY